MKNILMKGFLLAVGFFLGFITNNLISQEQLDYEQVTFEVSGESAIMRGVIDSSAIDSFDELMSENPELKNIIMEDVMGSADDDANLILSRKVREKGLNTYLPKDGQIASGGTDFFCAGVKRTIEEGAVIGVHSWATDEINDASELSKDDEGHKPYLSYYDEMGIPKEFYWFTINAAPGTDMHNMTIEEIEKYNIATEIVKADE
ncbi:MAG: hypothetical protein N4A47_02065 [Clostridia bacterium]|jgi:hypothetical protein|nr:hypothetical protein [Clostridia bacterium]